MSKGAEASPGLEFVLTVDQNPYLSADAGETHAILTVEARPLGSDGAPPTDVGRPGPKAAEVIVIDCSGSMGWPATKIAAARRATTAAIDTLRDGVRFAVVEGTHSARIVYPPTGATRRAGAETRRQAKRAVARLQAGGGTAIGAWLEQARQILVRYGSAIRHVILLTDGQNGEPRAELDRVLERCREVFVCDARGIGDDWRPEELLRIADVLHGTADAVPHESGLEDDFRSMARAAMGKIVADARIRITTGRGAQLRFLKQVFPTRSDLTGRALSPGRRTVEFTTGAWGGEHRDYHLCLTVDSRGRPRDEDLRAARVDLLVGAAPQATPVPVIVHWTGDQVLSTRINPSVAHYTGQAELSRAIMDGCEAYDRDDREAAERELGKAVQLAAAAGNDEVMARLERLVEVVNVADGIVRLRSGVARSYLHSARMGSRLSVLSSRPDGTPLLLDHPPRDSTRRLDAPDLVCGCGRISPPGVLYCEACGHAFDTGRADGGQVPEVVT